MAEVTAGQRWGPGGRGGPGGALSGDTDMVGRPPGEPAPEAAFPRGPETPVLRVPLSFAERPGRRCSRASRADALGAFSPVRAL